jgi:hypothetical protein
MGAEIGARRREPEASGLSVVVATDGRSPHLSDVVAAAARDPAVDDVNVVANGAGSRLVSEMDFPADARVFVVDEGNLSIARNLGLANFKVKMGPRRVPRRPDFGDLLALLDPLSGLDARLAGVGVERAIATRVAQNDRLAVAAELSHVKHLAALGCANASAPGR